MLLKFIVTNPIFFFSWYILIPFFFWLSLFLFFSPFLFSFFLFTKIGIFHLLKKIHGLNFFYHYTYHLLLLRNLLQEQDAWHNRNKSFITIICWWTRWLNPIPTWIQDLHCKLKQKRKSKIILPLIFLTCSFFYRFKLVVRQQPCKARLCSFKEKGKHPVDHYYQAKLNFY